MDNRTLWYVLRVFASAWLRAFVHLFSIATKAWIADTMSRFRTLLDLALFPVAVCCALIFIFTRALLAVMELTSGLIKLSFRATSRDLGPAG